jgi:hypothetical protein
MEFLQGLLALGSATSRSAASVLALPLHAAWASRQGMPAVPAPGASARPVARAARPTSVLPRWPVVRLHPEPRAVRHPPRPLTQRQPMQQ